MTSAFLPNLSEYIGWKLEVFTALFVPIQIFAVALRGYTQWLTQKPWGWDDLMVLIALGFQLIMAGVELGE